jgi:hypothetical protein
MNYSFIADVHIGNHKNFGGASNKGINRRCQSILEVFEKACARSVSRETVLVVLGDLFDKVVFQPQIAVATAEIIQRTGAKVILLCGNHEADSDKPGDHALGIFTLLGGSVKVIDYPMVIDGILFCPHRRPEGNTDSLGYLRACLKAAESLGGAPRALAVHLGLFSSKDQNPPWVYDAGDAVEVEKLAELLKGTEIEHVYAGNWHDPKTWEVGGISFYQVGALVPTGWNNPGELFGQVLESDLARVESVYLEGPRFLSVKWGDNLPKGSSSTYLKIECLPNEITAVRAALEGGDYAGLMIVPSDDNSRAVAHQAARAATSAVTLSEVVHAYLGNLSYPEDVQREEVAKLVLDALDTTRC